MPHKLELAPDFWRKRAEEARRLAELIEDNFTAESLLDIALQYDELTEHAERERVSGGPMLLQVAEPEAVNPAFIRSRAA
jgi:hypothetical protein